ncbi:hypothetical protein, partial [Paenibacillus sp. GCM10012303]|uniref:hypothetical protein n=1 Tax=Paenibacillus sp. GCM10012303 TaxID=3317340 RepID=UPI003616CFDA
LLFSLFGEKPTVKLLLNWMNWSHLHFEQEPNSFLQFALCNASASRQVLNKITATNKTVDSLCRSVSKTVPSEKLPSSAQTGCPESLDLIRIVR